MARAVADEDFSRVSAVRAIGTLIWPEAGDDAPAPPAVVDCEAVQADTLTGQEDVSEEFVGVAAVARVSRQRTPAAR